MTQKNYTLEDVRAKRKQREAEIGWTELREVALGAVIEGKKYIGDGGTKVWVTQDDRSSFEVERGDANVPGRFGRRVLIGKAPGRSYDQLFSGAGSGDLPGVADHASQHTVKQRWRKPPQPGDVVDPVYIGQHQITDLLIVPSSGFTFRVLPGATVVDGTPVRIQEAILFTVDNTEIPSALGEAVICRVELDSSGAVQLSYGTSYMEDVDELTAIANAPAADATRITLGYIWMPEGMTAGTWMHILPTSLAERTGGVSGGAGSVDASDVTYAPTTLGDWLTPPDDIAEAADELAGRVKAIEDAGGGGIGDYILITDQKTQNTSGGTFTNGADRTRDLNTKVDPANVASIRKLAFTSGGTYQVLAGDTITGATSGATATVFDVELTSGSWAAGTAAGNLWLNNQTGTFASENLDVGANANVATVSGNSTTNQVRLSAGTYRLNAKAPAHRVTRHQAWWQNVSDSTRVLVGTSEYAPNSIDATVSSSQIRGRFTIAAKKTFELQHRCAITMSSNGLGVEANFNAEVYSVVELVRE